MRSASTWNGAGEGTEPTMRAPEKQGLYDPQHEHDACGVGFVVDIEGRKSHKIVRDALQVLHNLNHRGACGCEANTGDGAGILMQTPDTFLRQATAPLGITLPPAGQYGVGMVFLPTSDAGRVACEKLFERAASEAGQKVLGWRTVPTQNGHLGETAVKSQPVIRMIFVARGTGAA